MKSKLLVILSTLLMALAVMAQSATETAPAPTGDSKTCACCNHDKTDGKMACCSKHAGCCEHGECAMKSKGGKCTMTHEQMISGNDKAPNMCATVATQSTRKMTCCGKTADAAKTANATWPTMERAVATANSANLPAPKYLTS